MANRRLSKSQDQRSSTSELSGQLKRSPSGAQLKYQPQRGQRMSERANKAGLAWPLPDTLSEQDWNGSFFPTAHDRSASQSAAGL